VTKSSRAPFRPGRYKASQSPLAAKEPQPAKRDAYDWSTLVIAFLGVVIVATSTIITAYQAYLSRESLIAAVSQQRAWLKTELVLTGPLQISGNGMVGSAAIRVTNVGNLPALGVDGNIDLVPSRSPGNPGAAAENQHDPYPADCKSRPHVDGGVTLFPGETAEIDRAIVFLGENDVTRVMDRQGRFVIVAATCVRYLLGQAERVGETAAFYHLHPNLKVVRGDVMNAVLFGPHTPRLTPSEVTISRLAFRNRAK